MFKKGGVSIMNSEFLSPVSVDEAVRLMGDGCAYFAGGTETEHLHSRVCASTFILLSGVDGLDGIDASGDVVRIGSMVSFTKALKAPEIPEYFKEALHFCGSLQKRNMATIGGNIASWRCDSYLIPTLLAAGAQLEIADETGCREISLEEYGRSRDSLKNALITAVIIPSETAGVKVISKRYANTVESHAYLTIAMGKINDSYRIGLAIKGSGIFTPDITSWGVAWKMADVKDDMFGSEAYKRYLTGVTLDDMYEKLSGEGGDQV